MIVKGPRSNPIGAHLNAAERKALNIEINKAIAAFDRRNELNIEAVILWVLHEEFGFGHDRLRRFYVAFDRRFKELCERYEVESVEVGEVSAVKLRDIGVDVEEWNKEAT